MTFTIITVDGTIMFREDIFSTREEAEEFLGLHPLTPAGKEQRVCDTETAKLIAAEVKAARERHARALDIERQQLVSRMLHNASL